MRKKWKNIGDLYEKIANDDTLINCRNYLTCVTYAPNIGYRSWIFNYKGTLVCLFDAGNGHYDFQTTVTYLDLLEAVLINFIDSIRYKTK